jgi:hypothetical protein
MDGAAPRNPTEPKAGEGSSRRCRAGGRLRRRKRAEALILPPAEIIERVLEDRDAVLPRDRENRNPSLAVMQTPVGFWNVGMQ